MGMPNTPTPTLRACAGWCRKVWASWFGNQATNRHNGDYQGRHRK